MTLLLECCERCFTHKQQMHQEVDFYDHYAKLSEKIANRCTVQIIKNPKRMTKASSALFFEFPKVLRQFYTQQKEMSFPRIGSFQVYFKDLCLYSKLSEGEFPDCNFICNLTLVLDKTDNVEHIEMMLKKYECASIYQLFKTVLLKPKLNAKEFTFHYKQMYQALNPQKKKVLNPNLPHQIGRTNKKPFLKSKYGSKVKSQTSFKYRDNTKITIQEQKKNEATQQKLKDNQLPVLNLRNSITQMSKKEANSSSVNRFDRKSSTMIESKHSLNKQQKQLTVFRRGRCKHFSNQYSNMTKRTELVSNLMARQFKEIKESNFEYLTRRIDRSEYASEEASDNSFSLQILSQSSSESSVQALAVPPLSKIPEPMVVKKRKKSHQTLKSNATPSQNAHKNQHLVPTIPVGDSGFKNCQKRFSSTLNGGSSEQLLAIQFYKNPISSQFRNASKKGQTMLAQSNNSQGGEQEVINYRQKEKLSKIHTHKSAQISNLSNMSKDSRKKSLVSMGNKENGQKKTDQMTPGNKKKIINSDKLTRNSQQNIKVIREKRSNNSKHENIKAKEKSNSFNNNNRVTKPSNFAYEPSRFGKTTEQKPLEISYTTQALKNDGSTNDQGMQQKQNSSVELQKSQSLQQRQSDVLQNRQKVVNNSIDNEIKQKKESFDENINLTNSNLAGQELIVPLDVESRVVNGALGEQSNGQEDQLMKSTLTESAINLYEQFILKNFNQIIKTEQFSKENKQSQEQAITQTLSSAIKQIYPSPFLVFETKHKKKLDKFFKNVKEKSEEDSSSHIKPLFSENDLCKVIAYSDGKNPVLFRRVIDLTGEIDHMQFFLTDQSQEEQKFMEYAKIKKNFTHLYFWFLREDYQLFGATINFLQQPPLNSDKTSIVSNKPAFSQHYNLCKPQGSQFQFEFKVSGQVGQDYHLFASYSSLDLCPHLVQGEKQESRNSVDNQEEVKILIWKANEEGQTEELVGEIQKKKSFFFELYLEPGNFLCKLIKCRGQFSQMSPVQFSIYSNSKSIGFHSEYQSDQE